MRSQLSWSILKRFSRKDILFFSFKDVVMEFPGQDLTHLRRTLASMISNGMLCKLTREIYHVVPLSADPESYGPDGRLAAKYIVQNAEYYIGYTSALEIHGLSLYNPARVYVVTEKQVKPAVRRISVATCQFIMHQKDRIFGYSKIWIHQLDEVNVSDLEKTIVDLASNPLQAGSIIELGKAIFKARNRTDYDTLFYYFARNGVQAAIKRYLYLVGLLRLEWTSGHELMMGELGLGTTLLNPRGDKYGRISTKLGLKINVDPELIRKGVFQ